MANIPAIPQPLLDPRAQLVTLQALKQAVEILAGQRGGTPATAAAATTLVITEAATPSDVIDGGTF